MTVYISLLRGINMFGRKRVRMDDLKILYETLGFENVQTYIQSGNVIFGSLEDNASELRKRIEEQIERSFGFSVAVMVRSGNEFRDLIENNPFLPLKKDETSNIHVIFLSEIPEKKHIRELKDTKAGPDEFFISGKEIYLYCPNRNGRTILSTNFFEKSLNVSATMRCWKPVCKLLVMVE